MTSENINISRKNIKGKCDLKCAYNFKYNESNSTAQNNGIMLLLSYDNSSVPPVLYNNQKYIVEKITIVSPSIHKFNNALTDAEFLIAHTPVNGGPKLNVAIPIKSSSESSTASNLITQIIQSVSTNAPSEGTSTNLNISGFNLQNIVPEKPFFSYTDNDKNDWIVFGILDYIPLNSSTLESLQKIIKPYSLEMLGGSLFLNSSGPNSSGNIGKGIYISCNPVGSSEEETDVTYSKESTAIDINNILENENFKLLLKIFIFCLIFIILFYIITYIYNLINGKTKINLPNINNNK